MDTQDLIELKEKIKKANEDIQKEKGRIEEKRQQLKEKGYNTEEDAEEALLVLEKDITTSKEKYHKILKEIEDDYFQLESING